MSIIDTAQHYIDMGLPIIPLCPPDHKGMSSRHVNTCNCPGKIPLIGGWQRRTETTIGDLEEWRARWSRFNIGLPLGDASGYVGIDIDNAAGERIFQEMSGGDIPDTWEYSTGAGRRLIYQIPVGMKTKKFKQSGKGAHEECALLCTGQQTVLPPSVHHTGKVYTWTAGKSPAECDCAEAPQWLIEKIKVEPKQGAMTLDLTGKNLNIPEKIAQERVAAVTDAVLADAFSKGNDDVAFMIPEGKASQGKAVKVGKTGHEITITPEMLRQPIPDGQRDDTMTKIVGHFCAKNRNLGKEYVLLLAKTHNQTFCDPPLDEEAIVAKVNYFWEAEEMKSAQFKNGSGEGERRKFFAKEFAQIVRNLIEDEGYILEYDPPIEAFFVFKKGVGPWKLTTETWLMKRIYDAFEHPESGNPEWNLKAKRQEVLEALKLSNDISDITRDSIFSISHNAKDLLGHIPTEDGILDWAANELKPWDPQYRFTYKLPIHYDPHADCPNWKKYLEEWLPDQEVRDVIQEYLGLCLIPDTSFETAMMLLGTGANGKSMFLNIVQKIFGQEVCASIGMDEIDASGGSYAIPKLVASLVNICADIEENFISNAGKVKRLISGETLTVREIYKAPYEAQNMSRFLFSANNAPQSKDKKHSWIRRWKFVHFERTFAKDNNVAKRIYEETDKELSGIFNWMVEGLARLKSNGMFTQSNKLEAWSSEYQQANDTVDQFVNLFFRKITDIDRDMVKVGGAARIGLSAKDVYDIYKAYTNSTISKSKFKERMTNLGIEYSAQTYNMLTFGAAGGKLKKTSCYLGLTLNYDSGEVLEELEDLSKDYPDNVANYIQQLKRKKVI